MISLRTYVYIWILIAVFMSYESLALNRAPEMSFVADFVAHSARFKGTPLTLTPGKTISLWLGWIGIGLMCLTNFYVLRKRWSPLRKLGALPGWLDFHIFCGLLGPTFILFHTNFKIGGLVAISFWSMVVSFASGIVGRYFYLQLAHQKTELDQLAQQIEPRLKELQPVQIAGALRLAGVGGADASRAASVFMSIMYSMVGDLRLKFGVRKLLGRASQSTLWNLRNYVVLKRRALYLDQFRQVMGYWHSFHLPFAVFMYVVAAIHIATALLFQV